MFEKIIITNAKLTEMKSRPREHARKVLSQFRLMVQASAMKRLVNCSLLSIFYI